MALRMPRATPSSGCSPCTWSLTFATCSAPFAAKNKHTCAGVGVVAGARCGQRLLACTDALEP
eukprot:6498778-Lingulodinium_polyedra.AAC.1